MLTIKIISPSIFTVSVRILTEGSQRWKATSSIFLIASSKSPTPAISPDLLIPIINCPPSALAKQTIAFAIVSLSGNLSLNSVCKFSPFNILS
jgi:hypothetical protein